jgi:hypothetical protein
MSHVSKDSASLSLKNGQTVPHISNTMPLVGMIGESAIVMLTLTVALPMTFIVIGSQILFIDKENRT